MKSKIFDKDIIKLENISQELESKSTSDIIKWTHEKFDLNLGIMTALGYSGIVLMDHLRKLNIEFSPYFIDTCFHFQETLNLLKQLEDSWNIKFNVIHPTIDTKQLKSIIANNEPWKNNPDLCCHHMKVEPLFKSNTPQSCLVKCN